MSKKLKFFISILFISILSLALLNRDVEHTIDGKIFNTLYKVKIITHSFKNVSRLEKKIEKELKSLNLIFSVFEEKSEINKFNNNKRENKPFFPSKDFFIVMKISSQIYNVTSGFWDPTISPLIDIWGFGTKRRETLPSKKKIEGALHNIGFNNIEIEKDYILKKKKEIVLNLSSIAKGYAVDKIRDLLKKEKIKDFIVEIGGEIYARGRKNQDTKWLIGINMPKYDAGLSDVRKTIYLENRAMATSGNYRNFFRDREKYYSHIISPKSGYPVQNGVVSVSVTHESCAVADGLATAIMVMGKDAGLLLAENLEDVEAFIVVEDKDRILKDYSTSNFFNLK